MAAAIVTAWEKMMAATEHGAAVVATAAMIETMNSCSSAAELAADLSPCVSRQVNAIGATWQDSSLKSSLEIDTSVLYLISEDPWPIENPEGARKKPPPPLTAQNTPPP